MDENEGMSGLVVFQEPAKVLKPEKIRELKSNEFETLPSKEKIVDMEVVNFFTSLYHPAWRYGFFTGILLTALINLIYMLITR